MDIEAQKRAASARALEYVRPGMRLGLGTGSTARHFVELLGERVRAGLDVIVVPIEVVPFGLAATRRAVEAACIAAGSRGPALLRRGKDGHAFVTDGGHWILDAALERISDPRGLADRLAAIAGVVEHGLFIGLAQTAVLAGAEGVRVIERP